ncbi:DMT family transporter [Nitratireductor soli]|uniref:DMT family transporter n=1 Tax=Nitratireductor soli TaxID=1670619 RepID=UPI00065DD465|nr:DMT family transporter [Nitratireductor soli]
MTESASSKLRRSAILPAFAVSGTVITWAASFPAIGMALKGLEPLPLAAIRFALAALLAIVWLAWRRPARFSRRDLATLVLCGILGIALYNVLLNSGQKTVSAGAASFIVNTQPMFMAILAVLVLKEAFNRWSWVGTALGFAGLAVIAWGQPGALEFGAGSSLILAAAVCAALFSVMQRPLFLRIEPLGVTAMVLLIGAVALAPWLPAGITQFSAASLQVKSAVLFLAVAPAAIGQLCWSFAIQHYGAARAGQFLYLIPPLATLIAWLMLGDVPEWTTIGGGIAAMTGVVIVNTWGRR